MRLEIDNIGGGSNNKKDHAAGKNLRCPLSFLFFFKTRSKSTFLCRIWSKMCPQKRTKKIMIFVFLIFYVLFCCFCRIWLTKCSQTENKKEQKRSCRRENRKMSFVFFVVGPPPILDKMGAAAYIALFNRLSDFILSLTWYLTPVLCCLSIGLWGAIRDVVGRVNVSVKLERMRTKWKGP